MCHTVKEDQFSSPKRDGQINRLRRKDLQGFCIFLLKVWSIAFKIMLWRVLFFFLMICTLRRSSPVLCLEWTHGLLLKLFKYISPILLVYWQSDLFLLYAAWLSHQQIHFLLNSQKNNREYQVKNDTKSNFWSGQQNENPEHHSGESTNCLLHVVNVRLTNYRQYS